MDKSVKRAGAEIPAVAKVSVRHQQQPQRQMPSVGEILEAKVFKITNFGAFVRLPGKRKGLIHISQVSDSFVKDVNEHLKVGDKIKARVVQVSPDGKIDLTLKGLDRERPNSFPKDKVFKTSAFEEKIKEFLKRTHKRQAELNGESNPNSNLG